MFDPAANYASPEERLAAAQADIEEVRQAIAISNFVMVIAARSDDGPYLLHACLGSRVLTDPRDIAEAARHLESVTRQHEDKEKLAGRTRVPPFYEFLTEQ
ncbi:hypothetical protein HY629_00010 [Candidatus Uhrbacteria bacterium]|nr:hypothetical protein [Candidatus Doudnabacteria bacterium]MBI4276215.1 hypothetical protein [Candidatus Uhrbacteria bacterium]